MSLNQHSVILPSVSVVLSPSSSKEDAKVAAAEQISSLLKGKNFEMLAVDLLEEGELITPIGVIEGRRYMVSFRQTENVVYLHPDYYEIMEIMERYTKLRRVRK